MLGKIKTTEAKAKELRSYVEKFISRAKNPTLANQRLICGYFSNQTVKKVLECGGLYKDRPGGYTRIIKLRVRPRDAAQMAILELVK